jgi:hypothetical protein
MPRRASSASKATRSTRPSSPGSSSTSAPSCVERSDASTSATAAATRVPPPRRTLASSDSSRRLSTTTAAAAVTSPGTPSTSRTLSCGSSSRTVPMPVRMAQARARQRCPSCRAAAPGQPLAGAVVQRGLAVEAGGELQSQPGSRTGHARNETDVEFPRLGGKQAASARSTPAARRPAKPCPATSGLGSSMAATTRRTPAASSASCRAAYGRGDCRVPA